MTLRITGCLIAAVGCGVMSSVSSANSAESSMSTPQDPRETSEARVEYEVRAKLAEDGDSDSMLQVFLQVRENLPELEDKIPDALRYLRKSAESENIDAAFLLGQLWLRGEWVDVDVDRGIEWLSRASQLGDHRAQFWLGNAYYQRYRNASSDTEKTAAFHDAERQWAGIIASPGAPKEFSLAAHDRLGLLYIRESMLDERGWELLFEAGKQGYAPAIQSIRRLRGSLQHIEEQGFSEVLPILEEIDSFFDEAGGIPVQ